MSSFLDSSYVLTEKDNNFLSSTKQPVPVRAPLSNISSILQNTNEFNSSRRKKIESPISQIFPNIATSASKSEHQSTEVNFHRLQSNTSRTFIKQYDGRHEFTYSDGDLPLRANTAQLIWACTPLGEKIPKSFSIRNTSEKWLRLNIDISGSDFILSNYNGSSIILQGNEIFEIVIVFCPTVIGASMGKSQGLINSKFYFSSIHHL